MKFLILIFATFIFFLAVKPGIDLISLLEDIEQSSCNDKCTSNCNYDKSKDQNQDDDCDGKTCNPFQVCSSCVLTCLNFPFYYIPKSTVFPVKGFTYHFVFTSQFVSDFWQPPKIV